MNCQGFLCKKKKKIKVMSAAAAIRLFGLEFNGPVKTIKVMSRRSV